MRRAGRIAALTGAAAAAFAAGEVYRYIFCRNSGIIGRLHEPRGHKEDYYLHRDGDAERLRRCRCIRLELTNDRGDTLEGYYYPCSGAPCGRIDFTSSSIEDVPETETTILEISLSVSTFG